MSLIDSYTKTLMRREWERRHSYESVFGPGSWDRRIRAQAEGAIVVQEERNDVVEDRRNDQVRG